MSPLLPTTCSTLFLDGLHDVGRLEIRTAGKHWVSVQLRRGRTRRIFVRGQSRVWRPRGHRSRAQRQGQSAAAERFQDVIS
jgi:hypothetical protein